jgi:hypothetical protein
MAKPKMALMAYTQASHHSQRREINKGRNGMTTTKSKTWTTTRGEISLGCSFIFYLLGATVAVVHRVYDKNRVEAWRRRG